MKRLFKKGDRVRSISKFSGPDAKLSIDDTGTVETDQSDTDEMFMVKLDKNNFPTWWYGYRFELISETPSIDSQLELARTLKGKTVRSKTENASSIFEVAHIRISIEDDGKRLIFTESVQNAIKRKGFSVALEGYNYSYDIDDVELVPTSITVKLNDKYDAIVSKGEVKVGCQTFPISVIEKILEAHKSVA